MEKLLEIMKNRRSVRQYTGDSVSTEDLNKVLKAGLLSPTGKSIKPWEFIVVRDKGMLEKLALSRNGAADMLKTADCAIVVIADETKTDVWIEDCSIAMAYMHLMADSLGLGSCWIQGRQRIAADGQKSDEYVRDMLGYPEGYNLEAILSLGIPLSKKEPHDMPDVMDKKIHYENF